jgi:hypothetical protein
MTFIDFSGRRAAYRMQREHKARLEAAARALPVYDFQSIVLPWRSVLFELAIVVAVAIGFYRWLL